MKTAELLGGPLDGQEVELPDPAPQVLLVPYLAEAHTGALDLTWEEINPNPLYVPCPVQLVYIRDRGRYRYRAGGW